MYQGSARRNAEGPHEEFVKQVNAYKSGKKVGFHCGGGKGRTGAVTVGTLMELSISKSLEEAEQLVQSARPVMKVKRPQREV